MHITKSLANGCPYGSAGIALDWIDISMVRYDSNCQPFTIRVLLRACPHYSVWIEMKLSTRNEFIPYRCTSIPLKRSFFLLACACHLIVGHILSYPTVAQRQRQIYIFQKTMLLHYLSWLCTSAMPINNNTESMSLPRDHSHIAQHTDHP